MKTQRDCGLSPDELVLLSLNSFKSSFLAPAELDKFCAERRIFFRSTPTASAEGARG